MPEGEWFCPACIKKKVLCGEAMTVSEGKTVKQVELSSEYVKKLAAKRRKKEEEEEEVGHGGIAHEDERDGDQHGLGQVHEEDDEDDVDVANHAGQQVLEGTEVVLLIGGAFGLRRVGGLREEGLVAVLHESLLRFRDGGRQNEVLDAEDAHERVDEALRAVIELGEHGSGYDELSHGVVQSGMKPSSNSWR